MVFSWIKLYQHKQSSNETVTVSGVHSTRLVTAAEVMAAIQACWVPWCHPAVGEQTRPRVQGAAVSAPDVQETKGLEGKVKLQG